MVVVGKTKIPYSDLFCLNNEEIKCIIEGHEQNIKLDFERSRMVAGISVLPYMKKGAKLDVTKIWPFGWDEKKQSLDLIERAKIMVEKLKKKGNGKAGN